MNIDKVVAYIYFSIPSFVAKRKYRDQDLASCFLFSKLLNLRLGLERFSLSKAEGFSASRSVFGVPKSGIGCCLDIKK